MDKLLKEFEILSLPSRVNFENLSDDCIDRLLENLNLNEVFEALKVKAEGATPFQWRKLREVCLISKSSKEKGKENAINFIIEVYEEAFKFNLKKGEMAECHISISKLIDFYEERRKFNTKVLGLIILFRFYYVNEGGAGAGEGLAEVATLLRNKIELKVIKSVHIQSVLSICTSNQNYWQIKMKLDQFDELEKLLINLIAERSKQTFILNILKSYPLVSVYWVKTLLSSINTSDDHVQEMIKDETGQLVEFNERKDKFIFKKRGSNK